MPYFNFYDDFDESGEAESTEHTRVGAFQYDADTVSSQFRPEPLSGVAAVLLRLMRDAGVDEMRVCYDGGCDEGFAHADDVWINGERKFLYDLLDRLVTPSNVETIRAAAATPKSSRWHAAGEHYRKAEPQEVLGHALDELAYGIASQLLGDGYGTGEYELYGAVIVNFETGVMMDDPNAEKPTDRM